MFGFRLALLNSILLLLCVSASEIAESAEPIAIGSRLELMVDDFLIDHTSGGAQLRLHKPTPREVAITHQEPWEGGGSGYHTIFRDGDVYRMYYRGFRFELDGKKLKRPNREVICYAQSADGIHWKKPNLGLIEFKGSKKNNIIWGGVGSHNFAPFKDTNPDCKPDEQYKALGGIGSGLYTFKSADGIHWSQLSPKQVITKGAFDSQNLSFWDSTRNRYVAFFRYFTEGGYKGLRAIATTHSKDFVNWSEPQPLEYPGSPQEQLYTNQITPYYRAPHIFFGFPTRYVVRGLTEHVKKLPPVKLREQLVTAGRRYGTDLTDGLFMTSRDGRHFKRWGEAFLRPGLQSEHRWIYGDNFQSWGLVETQSDVPGGPNELSFYSSEGVWQSHHRRQRRYSIRIDGFVSIQAPLSGGEVLTKPLQFSGHKLVLNYSTSAAGSVRVEIQDEAGKSLEGYSLSDCPEFYGDTIEHTVQWKHGPELSKLSGRPVRLRFVLKDADLYSFQFKR